MKKVSRKKVLISEQRLGEIGDRIKMIRKDSGLSLSRFASMLSVSKGNLSDIEKSRYKPSYQMIFSVVDKFGVSADWLLFGRGEPFGFEQACRLGLCREGPVRDIFDITLKIGELDSEALDEIDAFVKERFLEAVEKNDRRKQERRQLSSSSFFGKGSERRSGADRRGGFTERFKKK